MNTLREFNPNSSPEERYQELLESSLLPHEAHYVVYLEYHYKNYEEHIHVNETLTLKHIDPTHSEEMTAYMERTIHFLEFNLTQYLYMSNQTFDEEKLNHLNVKIREKMIHPPHENLHAMVKKSIIELLQDTQLTNELSSL